ncbi:hypothetical protein ACHAW6_010333 [Cyclotella cf. meneghiniana]
MIIYHKILWYSTSNSNTSITMSHEVIIPQNARAVCGKDLPPLDPSLSSSDTGSILLFYQYIEPEWTKSQHKQSLKKVIEIGTKFRITGRGRVAPEGLNCTLTGKPNDIRSFCYALREWDDVFSETDFKITDGLPLDKLFKSLSIRKTNELVAYGLAGEKAPSLKKFGGTHLEADQYHEAMQDPEAVIIDMYCTGGIRCERATALLNQMTTVSADLNLKGVYHCRGGIERYVKTYAEGGYWRGKNYLFDRRMEQTPQIKSSGDVESDIESKCCLCRVKWTVYRGQFKCHRSLCGVPVIVCDSCARPATENPRRLICELCQEGYRAPVEAPDLVDMKRKAEELMSERSALSKRDSLPSKKLKIFYPDRLFLSRLPLTATLTKVREALGPGNVLFVKWLTDKNNGGFYGSSIALLSSPEITQEVLKRGSLTAEGIKVDRKRIKVAQVFMKDDLNMFEKFQQNEYPPVGY